jgi:mannobiose 2-epimerase
MHMITLGLIALAVSPIASAGPDAIDAPALRASASRIEAELRQDILPFWMKHAPDRQHGGFFGEISNDLTVQPDAQRGGLLTTRVLWTFSAAFRRYRDSAYLGMARWAYDDLSPAFGTMIMAGFSGASHRAERWASHGRPCRAPEGGRPLSDN